MHVHGDMLPTTLTLKSELTSTDPSMPANSLLDTDWYIRVFYFRVRHLDRSFRKKKTLKNGCLLSGAKETCVLSYKFLFFSSPFVCVTATAPYVQCLTWSYQSIYTTSMMSSSSCSFFWPCILLLKFCIDLMCWRHIDRSENSTN